MSLRGKKSSAACLAIASPVEVERRLAPPLSLTDGEKAEWVAVVNSRPADWFGLENAAMLSQYCRHKTQADIVAAQLEAFDPKWLSTDNGMRRYKELTKMQQSESTAIIGLLRSMRLTQQSLVRAEKVVQKSRGPKPWEISG